jgi:hypothetical protein
MSTPSDIVDWDFQTYEISNAISSPRIKVSIAENYFIKISKRFLVVFTS